MFKELKFYKKGAFNTLILDSILRLTPENSSPMSLLNIIKDKSKQKITHIAKVDSIGRILIPLRHFNVNFQVDIPTYQKRDRDTQSQDNSR